MVAPQKNYVRVYRNWYAAPNEGMPFNISIGYGPLFMLRELTAEHLHNLRREIGYALEDGMVEMERGDLYGSPDDIEF